MVHIQEGEDPKVVPLAYYDQYGERHVIGVAAVQIKDGEVLALGQIDVESPMSGDIRKAMSINLESFTIGQMYENEEPANKFEIYEAAWRRGLLSKLPQNRSHITETNPDGEVRQCSRRDLHEPHEYQAEFGAYFNVFCPGNVGSQR